jgi:hypothetical protein
MGALILFTAAIIRAFRHGSLQNIDAPMLARVWPELEYRINV